MPIDSIGFAEQSNSMELRHLRYFLAVAEHLHFRVASEELLVSQPTLSEQIKDLEKELGVDLFDRIGRGIRLTQAGETFVGYARRVMSVLDEGQSAILEFDQLLRGRLRIGVVQTVGTYLMPRVAANFMDRFPKVSLRIESLPAPDIEESVSVGKLDLGISFGDVSNELVRVEPLFDEQFVLVVGKKHPLANRKRIRLEALKDESLCMMSHGFCTRKLIDDAFASFGRSPRVVVEMTTIEACVAVTAAGGLPTIVPSIAVNQLDLPSIGIDQPSIKRSVAILSNSSIAESRARVEFAVEVRRAIANWRNGKA
jgi:LysR family transcriptional regulator, cyn operon transcriptional activator